MKIGICEDDSYEREKLRTVLEAWGAIKKIPMIFYEFTSGEAFLEKVVPLDILFLDIKLPGIHGNDLAKKLRGHNKEIHIVFTTAYSDYMRTALDVHAYDYIEKPVDENKVRKTMDDLMASRRNRKSKELYLKTDKGLEKFSVDEILYFEIVGREVFVCTKTHQKIVKTTLLEIYKEIEARGFVYCNKGCIVNLAGIKMFKGKEIIMTDGTKKFLARPRIKSFKNDFIQFICNKKKQSIEY